MSVFRT